MTETTTPGTNATAASAADDNEALSTFKEHMARAAEQQTDAVRSFAAIGEELSRFVECRIKKDIEFARALIESQSPEQTSKICGDMFSQMSEDYSNGFSTLSEKYMRMTGAFFGQNTTRA